MMACVIYTIEGVSKPKSPLSLEDRVCTRKSITLDLHVMRSLCTSRGKCYFYQRVNMLDMEQ